MKPTSLHGRAPLLRQLKEVYGIQQAALVYRQRRNWEKLICLRFRLRRPMEVEQFIAEENQRMVYRH